MTTQEEIKKIEEEIRDTPYNKATQYHIGKLKAKLARLKSEQEKPRPGPRSRGYGIRKSGDATVLLVGFPSVGKSTLLNALTSADSKIADYDFTTIDVIPGMMEYNGAKIQLLDVPGLIEGAASGKGRGREVLSVVRIADLVLMMIDASKPGRTLEIMERELYEAGFRLDQKPPDVRVQRKTKGGVVVNSTVKLKRLDKEMIRSVLTEYKIRNAEVLIRQDITVDQLIDSLAKNRVYVPGLVVLNKIDLLEGKQDSGPGSRDSVSVSASKGTNLGKLRELVWKKLRLMRVYMKKIGREAGPEPLIVPRGSTVEQVCAKIHADFKENLDHARIWGPSARFPEQKVGPGHTLKDGDIVELHVGK